LPDRSQIVMLYKIGLLKELCDTPQTTLETGLWLSDAIYVKENDIILSNYLLIVRVSTLHTLYCMHYHLSHVRALNIIQVDQLHLGEV